MATEERNERGRTPSPLGREFGWSTFEIRIWDSAIPSWNILCGNDRSKPMMHTSFFKSLRVKSFVWSLAVVGVVAAMVGVFLMHNLVREVNIVEDATAWASIRRVADAMESDVEQLLKTAHPRAVWLSAVRAVDDLIRNNGTSAKFQQMVSEMYSPEKASMWTRPTLIAYYSPSYRLLWSDFHFSPSTAAVAPIFLGSANSESLAFFSSLEWDWSGMVTPPGGFPSMAVSFTAIRPTSDSLNVSGFLLWAREMESRVSTFANKAPACVSFWGFGDTDIPDDVIAVMPRLIPAPLSGKGLCSSADAENEWYEYGVSQRQPRSVVIGEHSRVCPSKGSVNTSSLTVGYVLLSDGFPGHPLGPIFRVDIPRNLEGRGALILKLTAVFTIVWVLLTCVVFLVFFEFAVLRRLERLNKFVAGLTDIGADEGVSAPDDSSSTGPGKSADEIGVLGRLAELRMESFKRVLAKLLADLEEQRGEVLAQARAIKLLNLWGMRNPDQLEACPAFVTASALAAKQGPPHDISAVLELVLNPVAFELLKAFAAQRGALSVIMFLADAAHLRALEKASSSKKGDPDPRTIAEAAAIWKQYLSPAANAGPLPIRRSVRKKLERHAKYKVGQFNAAVAEVTHVLLSSLIPEFLQSGQFRAAELAIQAQGAQRRATQKQHLSVMIRKASQTIVRSPSSVFEDPADEEIVEDGEQ